MDKIDNGAEWHVYDLPTESIHEIVCAPARNTTVIFDKEHTSNYAKPGPHSATCGGCLGTGIHAHFPARRCDYCNGTGLFLDECRVELADAISDALSDAEHPDANWNTYANSVGYLLADRGWLADDATIDALAAKLADTCDLDVSWHTYARAVVELLEERGVDVTKVARP